MVNINFQSTFTDRATPAEVAMVNDSLNEIKRVAQELGADKVSVSKNEAMPSYYHVSFQFSKGSKFIAKYSYSRVMKEYEKLTKSTSRPSIKFLGTFLKHSTPLEAAMVNDATTEIQECAKKLGADVVCVEKNKSGAYRPLTFAFYAGGENGGKEFLTRRTMNTLMAAV